MTRLALDRDIAAHHLTEERLIARPTPVPPYLLAVVEGLAHSDEQLRH